MTYVKSLREKMGFDEVGKKINERFANGIIAELGTKKEQMFVRSDLYSVLVAETQVLYRDDVN